MSWIVDTYNTLLECWLWVWSRGTFSLWECDINATIYSFVTVVVIFPVRTDHGYCDPDHFCRYTLTQQQCVVCLKGNTNVVIYLICPYFTSSSFISWYLLFAAVSVLMQTVSATNIGNLVKWAVKKKIYIYIFSTIFTVLSFVP